MKQVLKNVYFTILQFKFIRLLVFTILLSACTNATKNSVIPVSAESLKVHSALDNLKQLSLRKKQGSSGTKKINDPIATFYSDILGCDSGRFKLKDLVVDDIRISNHDVSTVANSLKVMGYNVINLRNPEEKGLVDYNCNDLPVIVFQSLPEQLKLSFNNINAMSEEDRTVPTTIGSLGNSNAGELDSMMVYYHPERKRDINKLKWLIAEKIDVASAQVYIETMVLEVREEDSKEFGINYSIGKGDSLLSIGSLGSPADSTIGWIRDTFVDPLSGLQAFVPGYGNRTQLKALIENGKAEVLSRPSVLAISNRQAVIQIVDVLQTANLSSTLNESGNLQVSAYEFSPLLIGITLNLKPRVSADRKWLTLEIDATVESEDDENSGQVFTATESGERVLLAEKQGSSSKKVKTFARIPDRTPIIIGGLVSSGMETSESKVPLLGDIPVLGKLFTSTDSEMIKREVIIVLTPYILAEDATSIRTNRAGSALTNRLSNSLLFDNKYQIKSDDLFDTSYFDNDEQFLIYRNKAKQIASKNETLELEKPINDLVKNKLPGSQHLINKMIFDVVEKSGLASNLDTKEISLADIKNETSSFDEIIKDLDFNDNESKFIISVSNSNLNYGLVNTSINHKTTEQQMVLSNQYDLTRLKNAIISRDIISLNGGYDEMMVDKLYPGKEISLPRYSDVRPPTVITAEVLEIYHDSRAYYQSMLKSIDETYNLLDQY